MRLMSELPPWLLAADDQANRKYARTRAYFRQMFLATPKWLTKEQRQQFYAVYSEMRWQRHQGKNVQVDHIVPLCSPYVCGLNVPWNLQIIGAGPNGLKGNHWWPDSWFENKPLPLPEVEPHQQSLPL